jgi:hypothetical protein
MPLPRALLDEHLARLNARRPPTMPARLESVSESGFVLSFPERALPEGECIDSDFSDIQWGLHDAGVTTQIVSARQDDEGRYVLTYEVVEWDA